MLTELFQPCGEFVDEQHVRNIPDRPTGLLHQYGNLGEKPHLLLAWCHIHVSGYMREGEVGVLYAVLNWLHV